MTKLWLPPNYSVTGQTQYPCSLKLVFQNTVKLIENWMLYPQMTHILVCLPSYYIFKKFEAFRSSFQTWTNINISRLLLVGWTPFYNIQQILFKLLVLSTKTHSSKTEWMSKLFSSEIYTQKCSNIICPEI